MIVVDASVVLEVLLNTPAAQRIARRLASPGETLHAPHLLDIEVAHALRRYALARQISAMRGKQALDDFADLRLTRYPHHIFLPRIWELRHNLTAYDAAYVALAEALPAPLLTQDLAIAATRGHAAQIEIIV